MTHKAIVEQDEARDRLREMLKPGDTVPTILRHVSRSGMMRVVSPIIQERDFSTLVAKATGQGVHSRHNGIRMDGCGTDMGFELVYILGLTLWPDGFECIGDDPDNRNKRCPSNDHSNGDRDYTPHHHASGGYALKQTWL